MEYDVAIENAFFDELEKIAASFKRLHVPKSRLGRRPMSVATLLRKEKDGTLFRKHGEARVSYEEGELDPSAAKLRKKRGEIPSRDDEPVEKREDGRENVATTHGLGQTYNNMSALGNSAAGT